MFLKEKRDGTIKGRACADGQKDKEGFQKKDATSTKVESELALITSEIDVHEKRDVYVVDING